MQPEGSPVPAKSVQTSLARGIVSGRKATRGGELIRFDTWPSSLPSSIRRETVLGRGKDRIVGKGSSSTSMSWIKSQKKGLQQPSRVREKGVNGAARTEELRMEIRPLE